MSTDGESLAHVVEVVKVKTFFVGDNFEQIALKAAFAKAVVKPTVAFEISFNGSSVVPLAVTANGADDFALIRVATVASFLKNVVRVAGVNFVFQVVASGTRKTFYSLDI